MLINNLKYYITKILNDKLLVKISIFSDYFLKVLVLFFFGISIYYFSRINIGAGDEKLFLNNLNLIRNLGWYEAISHKIPLTYLLLVYPISFLFKDFIALRLVNIFIFLVLNLYLYNFGRIKNKKFFYYFLFFSTSGWFMIGTNDSLFIASMVIFFNEVYKILETKEKVNVTFLFSSLVVAFFTRQLVYLYLPMIVFSFFFIYKKIILDFSKIKIPTLLFLGLVFLNIPSIVKNKNFSYDNKIPPKTVKSNWSQRQYLAQLMVNSGKIPNESHPSWEETDFYLKKNGSSSLPNSILSGVFFDLELTIKEFFKDFFYLLLYSVRQTGLILLIVLYYFFYSILNKKVSKNLYIPLIVFFTMSLFSFVIISYVEVRWLIPVYYMAIIYYSDLENHKKMHKIIPIINNLCIILIVFYGTFRVVNKLFI